MKKIDGLSLPFADYECIDPDLGSELWRLEDPDCEPGLKERLVTHVAFCADCRLRLQVHQEVVDGLRGGKLELPQGRRSNLQLTRGFSTMGLTALAASLALAFLMPPQSPDARIITRAAELPGIERPVPDEAVQSAQPSIRWTPVENVTTYKVTVRGVENDYSWTGETKETELRIPADKSLPADTRFRVSLETVPADLSPQGGWRSSFSRVSTLDFIGYRLKSAQPTARWSAWAGLFGLGAAAALALKGRRG